MASFCRPSRGETSTTRTRSAIARLPLQDRRVGVQDAAGFGQQGLHRALVVAQRGAVQSGVPAGAGGQALRAAETSGTKQGGGELERTAAGAVPPSAPSCIHMRAFKWAAAPPRLHRNAVSPLLVACVHGRALAQQPAHTGGLVQRGGGVQGRAAQVVLVAQQLLQLGVRRIGKQRLAARNLARRARVGGKKGVGGRGVPG